MRIAFVNQDPGIDPRRAKGAAVHLQAMRAAFRALGHDVACFDEPRAELLGTALASASHRAPFDLVYERYALGATAAAHFARAECIPHVLEVNAPLIEEARRFRELEEVERFQAAESWLFDRADLVAAVSTEVAAACRASAPDQDAVVVLPNGVDPELFHLGCRQGARERAGIPDGRFVLGFHGRLRPWHNLPALARVAAALLAGGVDAHLLCLGRGDFLGEAIEATDGFLTADRITHLDWVPYAEVGTWIGAFDALPLTYGADGPHYFSPIKLREAMAVGAVPVVPAVGDLTDAVRHGTDGLVYAAGDEPALAAALADLATDTAERERLSAAAAREGARHTWTGIAARVLAELGLGSEVPTP